MKIYILLKFFGITHIIVKYNNENALVNSYRRKPFSLFCDPETCTSTIVAIFLVIFVSTFKVCYFLLSSFYSYTLNTIYLTLNPVVI